MAEISTAFATPVYSGTLDTGANISGHITITTAGTVVSGPDVSNPRGFVIAGYSTNAGVIWMMAKGASVTTQAYPIPVGVQAFLNVYNLNQVDFNATTSGDIVCWMKL